MINANGTTMNRSASSTKLDLPSSKSPTLTMVVATEAEKQQIWTKNGSEWKGALPTVESYLRREHHLTNQDMTKDGGITIWILVDSTDPQRTILSSCETYRKKAVVGANGTVRDVFTQGIGSVFCPPECRGKGYGSRMLREIGELMRTWGLPEGQTAGFSILYSDIGKQFYNKLGWEPFNSSHIGMPSSTSGSTTAAGLPEARPLYASDLPELCTIDEQLVRSTLEHTPKDKTFVALIPDLATIRWHHAREEFVSNELRGEIPTVKGAIIGTEPGNRIWCYFNRFFYNQDPSQSSSNTLHILRIVVEAKGLFTWERASHDADMSAYVPAIAALFQLAIDEAKTWNMAEVEVWNPTDATVEAARMVYPGAEVKHRDEESIASLRWYGPRVTDGPVAEEIDWLGNEKYGWC